MTRHTPRRCGSLVVGLGKRGLLHARALAGYGERDLLPVVAYDHRANRRALARQVSGVIAVDSFRQLRWYEAGQIAVVATPLESHFQIASQLIFCAPRLLIEKPATRTKSELIALSDLSSRSAAKVFVGYSERVNPAAAHARLRTKELVRRHMLTHLKIRRSRPFPEQPRTEVSSELAVHDLDFVLNSLFRSENLIFSQRRRPCGIAFEGYSAQRQIHIEISADWVTGDGGTEIIAVLREGGFEHMTVARSDDVGRLTTLAAQLDRVFSAPEADPGDLIGESRVFGVLDGR